MDEFTCLEKMFCIHSSWTCDGDRDCPDDNDESLKECKDEVKYESAEAILKHNVSTVGTDVNPATCLSLPCLCSQVCIPTGGGHKCECLEGYLKVMQTVPNNLSNSLTCSGSPRQHPVQGHERPPLTPVYSQDRYLQNIPGHTKHVHNSQHQKIFLCTGLSLQDRDDLLVRCHGGEDIQVRIVREG